MQPPPPYGPPPQMAPPPKKGIPPIVFVIGVGVAFFLGIGIGAAGGTVDTGATPEVTVTKTVVAKPKAAATKTATAAPAGPATSFGDGSYRVGEEIKAGTYRAPGGGNCYWERLKDFKGELGSILANENPSGPTTVTIKSSDAGFQSHDCGGWKRL